MLSGRAMLEDLAKYAIELPSDEVETIGRGIYAAFGEPSTSATGEKFTLAERTFEIKDSDPKQVKSIWLLPLLGFNLKCFRWKILRRASVSKYLFSLTC